VENIYLLRPKYATQISHRHRVAVGKWKSGEGRAIFLSLGKQDGERSGDCAPKINMEILRAARNYSTVDNFY